jgi:hypothetical protein
LPRAELHVLLTPRQVLVARAGWTIAGGRPRRVALAPACIDCAAAAHGQSHWAGALAALETHLDAHPGAQMAEHKVGRRHAQRLSLHVTLSDRLVRYAAVPWQAALAGRAERLAYARDCMRQLYGAAADGWNLCLSLDAAGRAGLASAIDAELPAALGALCARSGTVMAALRPQLMDVFNRYRRCLRRQSPPCAWLLAGDADGLCGALFDQGGWRVARNLHAGGDWLAGLDVLLARETWLADPTGEAGQVYLWAPGDAALPVAAAGWPLQALAVPAQPGSRAWFGERLGIGNAE